MKKNIQKPISRVKFSAEHVPGVKNCKAIDGKWKKALKAHFLMKLIKKVGVFSISQLPVIFEIFFPMGIVLSEQFYMDLYNLVYFFSTKF